MKILLGVLILAACGPDVQASAYSAPPLSAADLAYSSTPLEAAAPVEQTEGFYAHSAMHVREEPKASARIIRTLARGDHVQLGARDGNGWAGLYTGGAREGYVYRAGDAVRRSAPAAASSTPQSFTSARGRRRSSTGSRDYQRGPRGGCYFYTSSGRKEYVDRSLCS